MTLEKTGGHNIRFKYVIPGSDNDLENGFFHTLDR